MGFIKNWLVASLKKVLIYEIQTEGDKLQVQLREAIAKEGPGAVDRVINAAESRIVFAVKTKGPTWKFLDAIREKVATLVCGTFCKQLREGVNKGVAEYGPTAVDLVFDKTQASLIKAIEALAL